MNKIHHLYHITLCLYNTRFLRLLLLAMLKIYSWKKAHQVCSLRTAIQGR